MTGIPGKIKTYHQLPNYLIGAQGTAVATNRRAINRIIQHLIGTGDGSWVDGTNSPVVPTDFMTCRYSCNSLVAGTPGDGVNRVSDEATHIIWANNGSAHTWWVLDCAQGEFELMVSCRNTSATGANLAVTFAPYGATGSRFTGGTTTQDPTTADANHSKILLDGATWGAAASTDTNLKLHIWKSTDSQVWRVGVGNGGEFNTFWFMEKALVADALWLDSAVACVLGATSGSVLTDTNLNVNANFWGYGATGFMSMALTVPHVRNTKVTNITVTNGISGKWGSWAQTLDSGTASNTGTHGELHDVRWGPAVAAVPTGSISAALEGTPAGAWAKAGLLWLPHCQTDFEAA